MAKVSDNAFPKIILTEQADTPDTPAAGTQKLFIDSADHLLYLVDENDAVTEVGGGGTGTAIYPQDVMIHMPQFKTASGISGGWTQGVSSSQLYNLNWYQATPANGDAMQTTVLLKDGTYDVYVLGIKDSSRGKIDWSMDGAAPFISGQDWYNATALYNVTQTGTVVIADSGRHLLKATVNGKNGSSSNYYMVITAVWLVAQSQASET